MARFVTVTDAAQLEDFKQSLIDQRIAEQRQRREGNFSKMSDPEDVKRAENLRRSRALAANKKRQGPRIAR